MTKDKCNSHNCGNENYYCEGDIVADEKLICPKCGDENYYCEFVPRCTKCATKVHAPNRIPQICKDPSNTDLDNWIQMMVDKGLAYHFEDRPEDIIKNGTADAPLFTEAECKYLNEIVGIMDSRPDYDPFIKLCAIAEA